jgi:predicted glycosyltransferase
VLLVPRELPRQEQLIRAQSLARVGAVDLARQGDLTPARLGDWLAGAVTRTQPREGIDLRGLSGTVRRAARLVLDRTPTKELSGAAG